MTGNIGGHSPAKRLVQRSCGRVRPLEARRQQRKHQHQMPARGERPASRLILTGPDDFQQMIDHLLRNGIILFQYAAQRRHVHIGFGKGRIGILQQGQVEADAMLLQREVRVGLCLMRHKRRNEDHLSAVDGQRLPIQGDDSVSGFQIEHLIFPMQMPLVPQSGGHIPASAMRNVIGYGQFRKFGHKVLKIHAGVLPSHISIPCVRASLKGRTVRRSWHA